VSSGASSRASHNMNDEGWSMWSVVVRWSLSTSILRVYNRRATPEVRARGGGKEGWSRAQAVPGSGEFV
jgi:hypothetical protein